MMSTTESGKDASADNGASSAANVNSSHNNGYSMSAKSEPESSNIDSSSNINNNGDSNNSAGGQATSMSNSNASSTNNNDPNNTNTSSSSASGGIGDDICRDFLRNVCRRGKACRFKHPDPNDAELINQRNKEQFVFCHDYQNRECRRENCRFLHCTKQEEELYRATGKLPPNVQAQMSPDDRSVIPVCKDFLNGTCRRGPGRCKYRHPLPQEAPYPSTNRNGPYDGAMRNDGTRPNYPMDPSNHPPNMDYQSPYGRGGNGSTMLPSSNYGYNDSYAEGPNKRKRYDGMYDGPSAYTTPGYGTDPSMAGGVRNTVTGGYMNSATQSYYTAPRGGQPAMDSRAYLEENAALRRRIDDLKKQVSDLLSTNEYLMEQMNQMRAQSSVAVASSVAGPLQQQPQPGSVSSTAAIGMSAPMALQAPAQAAAAVAIGPLPPVSIVSSIASISLPTVSAPVTLVNSSAASLASFTPSMHSTNPWPLGVDQ